MSPSWSEASAPESIFLSITEECPQRCKVCSMWEAQDPADSLTPAARLKVVRQLPDFGRPVHAVITGGEPFTKVSEVLAIGRELRSQGNTLSVVTSGMFLKPEVVKLLEGSGLSHLAVSIDYPTAEQHDAQRGRPGTFDRAVAAIKLLAAMRAEGREVPTIGINTIVMGQNLNYLEELAEMASQLGVSEILFQPIQPDFGLGDKQAFVKLRNWLPLDPAQVDETIDRLDELRGFHPVRQAADELHRMKQYFRDPRGVVRGSCRSAAVNMMVDVRGVVRHCFGQPRTGVPPLGKVPEENLVSLWNSRGAVEGRQRLANCSLGCGALLCHSRSSLPPPAAIAPIAIQGR